MRTFEINWTGDLPSIEADDLTLAECRALRRFLATADVADAGPALRVCLEPHDGSGGWCIVEFLAKDREAIQRVVSDINVALRKAKEQGR